MCGRFVQLPVIDFGQPAGLLLVMVLHFIADAEDPWRIVATLRDAVAPGSYLVLAHATNESRPAAAQAAETVYNRSVSTDIHMRSRADILRFFDIIYLTTQGGPGTSSTTLNILAYRRGFEFFDLGYVSPKRARLNLE